MKKKFLKTLIKEFSLISIMMLLSGITLFGQDIQFPRAIVVSGGGNSSSGAVNVARWRIGQINLVTLPANENGTKQATITDATNSLIPFENWSVNVYPNPVNTLLKVRFELESTAEFSFELYDVGGRKLMAESGMTILNGQEAEINMSRLNPALYLLKITPAAQGAQKVFKITKQ